MVSQLVDTTAVILITHFYAHALPIDSQRPIGPQLFTFIATGYAFKFAMAAIDTVPFYIGVRYLSRYLQLDPIREHDDPEPEPEPEPEEAISHQPSALSSPSHPKPADHPDRRR
jgi:hypothetical protein